MMFSQLIRTSLLLTLVTAAVAQERLKSSIEIAGGQVTVDYTATKIGSRSPADIPVGTVWRMSKDAAAQLTTTVPLASRSVTLAPGTYRLSARRVSESKWELVIFQGGFTFQKGMAHQTSSLRLDEEEDLVENLTIAVKKSRSTARIKLTWGKYSLNTRLEALPTKSFDGTIGGTPAKFTFFGISVGRNQNQLTRGKLLTIGSARQTGENGLEFSVAAQQKGNDVDLIFTNVTLSKLRTAIKTAQTTERRFADRLPQLQGERATQLRDRIESLKGQLVEMQKSEQQAAAFAQETRIAGSVGDARPASRTLEVAAKKGETGLDFAITFGAKIATFRVLDASMKRK